MTVYRTKVSVLKVLISCRSRFWKEQENQVCQESDYEDKKLRLYSHFVNRFCSEILLLQNDLFTEPAKYSGMNCPHVIETEVWEVHKHVTWRQLQWKQISTMSKITKIIEEEKKLIWKIQKFYVAPTLWNEFRNHSSFLFTVKRSCYDSCCGEHQSYVVMKPIR